VAGAVNPARLRHHRESRYLVRSERHARSKV